MVRRYETQPMIHHKKFCEWLGVDARALSFIINRHRNHKVWQETFPGKWILREEEAPIVLKINNRTDGSLLGFVAHRTLEMGKEDVYTTIGKGYPI